MIGMGSCVICLKLFSDGIAALPGMNPKYEKQPTEFCQHCEGKITKIRSLVEDYDKIRDIMVTLGLTICNIISKKFMASRSNLEQEIPEEFQSGCINRLQNFLFPDLNPNPDKLGMTFRVRDNEKVTFPKKILNFFGSVEIPAICKPPGSSPLKSDETLKSNTTCEISDLTDSHPAGKKTGPHSVTAKNESSQRKTKICREKPIFQCPSCQKKFMQKRSLDLHFQNHHVEDDRTRCQVCEKTFDSKVLLSLHLNLHQGSYKCTNISCKKSFRSLQLLANHSAVHSSNPLKFDCNFCFQMFDNFDDQKNHELGHFQTQKTFLCEHCGESFPSTSGLADHRKRAHNQSEFSCPVCGKMFRVKSVLKVHERTHNGERPFRCDQCTYSSAQSSALRLHKRKHSGLMPYKCDHCNHPGYCYKQGLRQHLAESHPGVYLTRKKNVCQVCWKNFGTEKELDDHSVQHDKYKCKICDRQFKMLAHLNEHLLRHADVKRFKCEFCEMDFTRRKALLDHITNIHPNENPERSLASLNLVVQFEDE